MGGIAEFWRRLVRPTTPFTWLEPGRVAGGRRPRDEAAFAALAERGIVLIVNLHRRPHDTATLARHGLRQLHLPTRDFTPPPPAHLAAGVAALDAALAADEAAFVHCGAGLGRTGTLLACWLTRHGDSPQGAIARVRAARPGSVDTRRQVAAVAVFARRDAENAPPPAARP
jgi:atypical dual specificity phosphatase